MRLHLSSPSMMQAGAGLIKMFVLMVLMAACILVGFSVFANWDKDANGDGAPDGFTLRLFDLQWYGIAGETARPLAKDLKVRMLEVKEKVLAKDGLIDKGEDWYKRLLQQEAGNLDADADDKITIRTPDNPANKQEILRKKLNKAEEAVTANDPEQAYKFDAQSVTEKPTLHLEDDILVAGQHFKIGLDQYRSAFDERNELKPGYDETLYAAELELRTTQKMLSTTVPEYGKRADKDPAFEKNSLDVLEACNELIALSFDNIPRK